MLKTMVTHDKVFILGDMNVLIDSDWERWETVACPSGSDTRTTTPRDRQTDRDVKRRKDSERVHIFVRDRSMVTSHRVYR